MNKKQQAQLDAQLAHWQATDKASRANIAAMDAHRKAHPDSIDRFDVQAYQRMIYSNGWNK